MVMESIGNIIRRIKHWDKASAERELLREENIARATRGFNYGPGSGLVSYIRGLRLREEGEEANYDIASLLWRLSGIAITPGQTFETWKSDRRYPVLKQVRDAVYNWAVLKGPPFLTLAGPPGTGKTHLAISAAQLIVSRGGMVMYRRVSQLLDELRRATLADNKEEVLADVRFVSFLILDDLGAEKLSEWTLAALDEIVDLRYSLKRHLLVCTNAKSEDLSPRIGDRLSDKAIGEVIQLAVPSFRRGR